MSFLLLKQVVWQPWGAQPYEHEVLSPTLFRGLIRANKIVEPYMPDRVLRQFGITQGVPVEPIRPVKCKRGPVLVKDAYTLQFAQSDLALWDEEQRPLIQLSGPRATRGWDVTRDYLDYIEEYMHVDIDPNSAAIRRRERQRRPHTVDTLAVRVIHLLF